MKIRYSFILSLLLSICVICGLLLLCSCAATSGKVVGNQFTDDIYNIKVTFPGRYNIKPLSKNTKERVEAISKGYEDTTEIVKPTFAMSVYPSEQPMDSFILSVEKEHFYEDYYRNYNKELEKDIKVNGYPARLIYFSSQCGGDQQLLSFSHNKGITAYIKIDTRYVVMEYITTEKWYNEREFLQVLDNIEFGNIPTK